MDFTFNKFILKLEKKIRINHNSMKEIYRCLANFLSIFDKHIARCIC